MILLLHLLPTVKDIKMLLAYVVAAKSALVLDTAWLFVSKFICFQILPVSTYNLSLHFLINHLLMMDSSTTQSFSRKTRILCAYPISLLICSPSGCTCCSSLS